VSQLVKFVFVGGPHDGQTGVTLPESFRRKTMAFLGGNGLVCNFNSEGIYYEVQNYDLQKQTCELVYPFTKRQSPQEPNPNR